MYSNSKKELLMKMIDLTGKKIGRLLVLGREICSKSRAYWKCLCDCGKEKVIFGNYLRNGDTSSCGCLRKDKMTYDLTGKVFGKLTAINSVGKKGKSNCIRWNCRCECGNYHEVSSNNLMVGGVKSCGCYFDKSDLQLLEEAKKRFFANVDKSKDCWTWLGLTIRGYGVMFFKKQIKAHRFSYMIFNGKLNPKKYICHTCDNKLCVNPDHLYEGTAKENSQDALKRNLIRTGEKSHFAKLKKEDVLNIINSHEKGVNLAKHYGISENHISRICNRKSWANT